MASTANIDQIIASSDNNLTALTTILAPQWVSAPSLRGTSSIRWSCISTLVACVYTALHLNIPKDTSTWAMLKLKGLWVTIALLAPEIVVYMAISQLFEAWKLKRGLHELFGEDCGIELEYCFFVVMGGVQLKSIHPDLFASNGQRPSLSVSPKMMLWSAKLDRRMHVERKRIQDKSKADLLQKCLVLFQATWMAVQCIARRALGLLLTLLEVHTMVHVLCAAVMYAFWLKKPKDVREPERLDPDGIEDIAALLSETALRTLAHHGHLFVIPKRVDHNDTFSPKFKLAQNRLEVIRLREKAERQRVMEGSNDNYTRKSESNGSEDPEATGNSFRWNTSSFDPVGLLEAGEALPCGLANMGPTLRLTPEGLLYWNRVLKGLDLARVHRRRTEAGYLYSSLAEVPESSVDDSNLRFPFKDLLLLDHFPTDRSMRNSQFYIAMILPAIYGGIHLAVTSFEFTSPLESRLWLYSGLYIAIGLPIWEVMAWLMVIYESTGVTDKLLSCLGADGLHKWFWTFVRSVIGRVFLLIYTLARLYIIVESFISLRHVPIGVYLTPSWLQMIPHI